MIIVSIFYNLLGLIGAGCRVALFNKIYNSKIARYQAEDDYADETDIHLQISSIFFHKVLSVDEDEDRNCHSRQNERLKSL
jgi:hypothetical protein